MSDTFPTEDLSDLYEQAPCGYISLSPDTRIVKANRTLANWLGLTASELLGRSFLDVLSFGGRIAYETHLAPLLRLQGFVDEIALDLIHADGSKIPVIANATEKRDEAGKHHFTRFTLLKAVDRLGYERGLRASLTKVEAAFAAEQDAAILREQFIAVLGHDLRNPLAAITAGVQMLQAREQLSERGDLILREMLASGKRASALIDNVLDFARNRLGNGFEITCDSREPLQPVLEQVVAEMRTIAPDRVFDIALSIEDPVYCDRVKIGQLVGNLLSNAVTHGDPEAPIRLTADTLGDRLSISVANGGAPIDAATQDQLFQPFFRGTVRSSQNGLGLGLFIVSEIAKAHEGSIGLVSNESETRFTFLMPLTRDA
ncbi:PAS domain-containing sensor histidine kinase [Altererythrobacter sp. Root672]|uniref:sensor histidine kinase n=1 Tax=Altererythrobacter sp. Root672 TaxID=1736584 RepID=UPI0006FC649A|nr:PAS domain-containing sensor histidine kinase [Altererythrobacter sp. Root672]KRA83640.1 PAS domain-containing sensor histidine kinase [Altererythrobacter sp. Root672]